VIIPSTGKVIYWETVSSAASLGLSRQKQNGIQGSTPGMLSGEYATEILNVEPSGIIATFSSGRVAHITLRDPQGKPSVLVNFLRSTAGNGGGGLLGGIKNVLGGGYWRKEVTAVRAGGSHQRGQRDVIIATSTGLIEVWDTHWNHGNTLKKRYDAKDEIMAALPQADMRPNNSVNDLQVLDFAFSSLQSSDDPAQSSDGSWRLFLIVRSPQWSETKALFVVQVHLSGTSGCRVLSTHAVDLHHIPAHMLDQSKPKIFVPKPEETAFILIGQSLVILSLTSAIEETPSSQLLLDSNKLPLTFQDTIHLRSGKEHEILGSISEDQSNDSSCAACVLMLRNFGVIRVTVLPRPETANDDIDEPQITAKHKLEQAVFFGTMAKNPLNLSGESDLNFPPSEMEQASLEICSELLQSSSRFIPTTAISVEQNLRLRAKALDDLASLLLKNGNPLSRPARWELLWAAEKIAAQRAMWKVRESLKIQIEEGEEPFLNLVIGAMNDNFKTQVNSLHGEADPVRQWFLRDSYRMEHIIPWIKNAIKRRRGNTSINARTFSDQILEASELFLAVTQTAFRYREEHIVAYGLGEDFLEDGVLSDGYEDLPEFWTSRAVGYSEAGHLLDLELDSCRSWKAPTSTADAPDTQVLNQVARNSYHHLHVIGQMHLERTRWLSAQGDPKLMDESVSIEQAHVVDRKWQLFKLAGIGHLYDAIQLAEGFRDMGALVELIVELHDQERSPSSEISSGQTEIEASELVSKYFDKFGDIWADAYFTQQLAMGYPGSLLMRDYQSAVTRFLRRNPAYSRLSWINDVTGEDDYDTAAASLETLALDNEKDLWSHRVELSLAKLGKLATQELKHPSSQISTLQEDVSRLEDYVEVDGIQDILYSHIQPTWQGAIDRKAESELALDFYGGHLFEDRPSLHEILSEALSTLVNRQVVGADGLIDLLTLMGPTQPADDREAELFKSEFHLALQVLDYGRYGQRDPSYLMALQRLIWRRCLIKDDWVARGKDAEKPNGNSANYIGDTALYRSLIACLEGEFVQNALVFKPILFQSRTDVLFTEPRAGVRSIYTPLSPAEALMADSDSDILVSRFRSEQKSRVALDLQAENDTLRRYIEVGKLDFWFQNLRETAEAQSSVPNGTINGDGNH
jgi:nuclear pore complex protein Nup133